MKRLLLPFLLLIFLSACAEKPYVKKSRPYLGTIVEISVADNKPRQLINNAITLAFAEIERVENLLSRFNPESDISRINANGHNQPTKVSPETIDLLKESIKFSRLTNGAFDITISPLGYQDINIIKQEQSVSLVRQGMALDLGGIAKGYAVDKAIAVLRKEGIKCALVNAGGDIYAMGGPDKIKKWRIALQHPRKKNSIMTVLELQDRAVATSGDYQRYVEIDGGRYSHIINSRTGYRCQDVPASVTVIAGDCLSADALATSIFVLGPEKGIDLVNRLKNTEAIVASIRKDRLDILVSKGLKGKLEFKS